MKAVILAGGRGTRLEPYTTIFPKPMLPIGDRPILEIIIKQLAYYGFYNIVLSVGYLAELIQAYFQNSNKLPKEVTLTYVKEDEPLGTAGSLSLIPELTETFLVMNGDVLTTLNYRKLVDFHKKNNSLLTIAMHKRKIQIDFGVISTNDSDALVGYNEKPTLTYLVSMGVYIFEPKVLRYIKPNTKLDFPDLVKILLAEGEKVQGYSNDEYWLDIGRPDDYAEAVKIFPTLEEKFIKN